MVLEQMRPKACGSPGFPVLEEPGCPVVTFAALKETTGGQFRVYKEGFYK